MAAIMHRRVLLRHLPSLAATYSRSVFTSLRHASSAAARKKAAPSADEQALYTALDAPPPPSSTSSKSSQHLRFQRAVEDAATEQLKRQPKQQPSVTQSDATAPQSAPTAQQPFPGSRCTFTHTLEAQSPRDPLQAYRLLDERGNLVDPDRQLALSNEQLIKAYELMVQLQCMDTVFYDAQRQGRISFYMTNFGEEAIHIGTAMALDSEDEIFAQYREAGVLLYRGFTLENFANQLFATHLDLGKGRQMPVHYGSRKLHWQTISSPLGTQIPQAAGAAYALKREGNGKIVCCYFGEGAASEGDFHAGVNMAATLKCPVMYFVRNNGYAISTPAREQYVGDGIASRAAGYGIDTIRCDGNDLLAVFEATQLARKLIVERNMPVLVEAMTYRMGHHSTSDDSTRYRGTDEIQYWMDELHPVTRLRHLLEKMQLWDSAKETALRKTARKAVLKELAAAEQRKRPATTELFSDVYDELPPHLLRQQEELRQHLQKHGDKYGLTEYVPDDQYQDPGKAH